MFVIPSYTVTLIPDYSIQTCWRVPLLFWTTFIGEYSDFWPDFECNPLTCIRNDKWRLFLLCVAIIVYWSINDQPIH